MRRFWKRLLAVPAVAAALSLAAPTPASALPMTVTPTGPVSFDGGLYLLNVSTGALFSCSPYHLDASAQNSSPIFLFYPTTNRCIGSGGLQADLIPISSPWGMDAYSIGNGEVAGPITGMYLTVKMSDGCQANISGPGGGSGTVAARYSNTGELDFPAGSGTNLRVTTMNALCDPLLINIGDAFAVGGALFATPIVTVTP
ncbi:hypothetical protein [Actinomadura bangladeshensis]|uniref:Secreted protein n=1 Tax=Actinomadura bangladeshensis TaxID=453573 RepID=A0A4R4NTC2_9ACTN|nr:hypothetical protein [Actinomadura bangladeshensis]TDC12685.1 hypothetical protein E1284_22695 [Actinomadura bangladeshensis]